VGDAMNEKASLLNQLRIDRGGAPESGSPLRWWLMGGAAVVVIGLGGWFTVASNAGVPVHAVAVQKIETGNTSAGASLLDASGYVVAQLQAAVSGKNIYKVTSILVSEGQHVKKDEIIARLDDSTQSHAGGVGR
jgi:multidrug efflux pump subunit AcrA (membrane-fusion protein)